MPKQNTPKGGSAKFAPVSVRPPVNPPPLFGRTDWWTAGLTFAIMWVIYLLTLAPELTLEDCGELVTGSFYAGIPHPPGYPVWTIYSWLWTVLLPFGNPAWRVAVGEAFSGAVSCGLIALIVSRGGRLLLDGVDLFHELDAKLRGYICAVSGMVAGLLMGLDGFMWR